MAYETHTMIREEVAASSLSRTISEIEPNSTSATRPDQTSVCEGFVKMFDAGKTRVIGLPYGEKTMTIR